MMILSQQFRLGPKPLRHLVEDRAMKVLRHLLREHRGPQSLLPDDLALIRLQSAQQEAEERRFAGAVAAQKTHPLARFNRQIGTIQDWRAAKAQGDIG